MTGVSGAVMKPGEKVETLGFTLTLDKDGKYSTVQFENRSFKLGAEIFKKGTPKDTPNAGFLVFIKEPRQDDAQILRVSFPHLRKKEDLSIQEVAE